MNGECVGKVTAAPGGKIANGSSILFLHLDIPICLLLPLVYSLSLLHWSLLSSFIHSFILTCSCLLSVIMSLILLLTPALFPTPPIHQILGMPLLLTHSLLFLDPSPFLCLSSLLHAFLAMVPFPQLA